jgi:hypothetical protein
MRAQNANLQKQMKHDLYWITVLLREARAPASSSHLYRDLFGILPN